MASLKAGKMSLAPQSFDTTGPVVKTDRLTLVAFDAELARLQLEDLRSFFAALGAKYEPSWPPELNDEQTMAWTKAQLEAASGLAGWYSWVFLMGMGPGQATRAVGIGGVHGPPGEDGVVEIGYSMLPTFREQGLATEAVEGLLSWARRQQGVRRVTATTLDHLYASRRVLEKTGFTLTGEREGNGSKLVDYARTL